MIHFRCPGCTAAIEVPDNYAGRAARCPTCGHKLRVPRSGAGGPSAESETPTDLDDTVSSTSVFRVEGRAYQVRARLEGLLIVSSLVIALSIVVFVAVGLTVPTYDPWTVAGLIAAGFALFGALLVLPAYNSIRRSRGRKGGERLAFINVAAAAVLVVTFLTAAAVTRALSDYTPCDVRLEMVGRALRDYAAKNQGRFPPRPERLVELGMLAPSTLTCPRVPGARSGDPTYARRSWAIDTSGQAAVDLRHRGHVSLGFPDDLLILLGGGVHEVVDQATGRTVQARWALTLGGRALYIPVREVDEELERQRSIIYNVRKRRAVEEAVTSQDDGAATPDAGDDGDAAAPPPTDAPEED